jgi:cyclophilin family peptidyl-prolyl cis-trans isomerase
MIRDNLPCNKRKLDRIIIELKSDIAPIIAENFRRLCTGEEGSGYFHSIIHRGIPDLFIMGGDIINFSGTGGKSVYGPYFEDENFILKDDVPGTV